MKLYKSALSLLFSFFIFSNSSGQNWMMAQKYMYDALDSIVKTKWPVTGKLAGVEITNLEYDDIFEEYTIDFTDTVICSKLDIALKKGEEPDTVVETQELTVPLVGGYSIIEDENGDLSDVTIQDLSEYTFIYNEVGRDISFSLSTDDKTYSAVNLKGNQYYYYPCDYSDFAYIKIYTVVDGKTTGNVHYKLSKSKGYKVKYDTANAKFEVYLDERMNIGDFIK